MSILALLLAGAAIALWLLRRRHERVVDELWSELVRPAPAPDTFEPAMLIGLPAPVRRWLARAIAPGTPLAATAVLRMHGSIVLDERRPPLPFTAEQVLAPPRGFVWRARVGSGMMRMRGFDRYARGRGELRWWLYGLIPVVNGSGPDVDRSAAGRLAGEAALVPAALLPGQGVRWEPLGEDGARARVAVTGEDVAFTIRVAADGTLQRVVIDRWNGDPRNGPIGVLPFIVDFEGERVFGGYTLPARLAAGWGPPESAEPRYFFRAELDEASFR